MQNDNKNNTNWHSLEVNDLMHQLNSSQEGLSEQEVQARLKKYGPNRLPEEKPLQGLKLFISQFADPLIYILVIAVIISSFLKEYGDAIIISVAVFVNTIIGYVQEAKASSALSELKKY